MSSNIKKEEAFEPKTLRGSCHCGNIKYLLTLRLPTDSVIEKYEKPEMAHEAAGGQRTYKCNCTTCHKLGFFHGRPVDPPNSFFVLSPLPQPGASPELGPNVGVYRCFTKSNAWYFCQICGTTTFAIIGDVEVVDKEIDVPVKTEDGSYKVEKQTKRVWHISEKTPNEHGKIYCSINMSSIDQDQPWLDLRKLCDLGCVQYLDWLTETDPEKEQKGGKPFLGGMY